MTTGKQSTVALVTGGARGIGEGITKRLLQNNMQVVIADIDTLAAVETVARYGSDVLSVPTDVSDEDAVRKLLAEIDHRFGRLDVLINNAGIARADNGSVETLSLEHWNRVLATNLTGIFLCCKHAVPLLRRTQGAIVNIASTRALQSEADSEAYAASKGGVVALTHALAVSLGPDIRVNCISPGWIDVTELQHGTSSTAAHLRQEDHLQHPVGRVGKPEDVANCVVFLISGDAAFITGQNIVLDGGMTRKMIYA